jgi:DNA (cytosine-5)-methyltransferase 1
MVVREAMGGAYNSGGGKVGFFRSLDINKPSPTILTYATFCSVP